MSKQKNHGNGETVTAEQGGVWFKALPEEPFRLFFPLGALVSLAGVSLWPLLYGEWLTFYPGVAHARLMMGGFVGAFSLGFLGTALPRMMGVPHLRAWELIVVLLLYLVAVFGYGSDQIVIGDAGMLAALVFFFVAMILRLIFLRQDLPPPSFVLVGLGWLGAMTGLVIFLLEGETEFVVTGMRHRMAALLFYQGFILLPILGIGGFLFPRFVGLKTLQMFKESRTPPPGWSRKACEALGVGLIVVASFWVECSGWVLISALMRFGVVAWYLWREVLVFRKANEKGTLAFSLRMGLALIVVALPLVAFFPGQRVGMDHIIFISGFGLVALTVASRVTFGHSGHPEVFGKKLWVMRVVMWAIVIAMVSRVTAEFTPKIRISHLNYAALSWVLAVLVWLGWAGRRFFQKEE